MSFDNGLYSKFLEISKKHNEKPFPSREKYYFGNSMNNALKFSKGELDYDIGVFVNDPDCGKVVPNMPYEFMKVRVGNRMSNMIVNEPRFGYDANFSIAVKGGEVERSIEQKSALTIPKTIEYLNQVKEDLLFRY